MFLPQYIVKFKEEIATAIASGTTLTAIYLKVLKWVTDLIKGRVSMDTLIIVIKFDPKFGSDPCTDSKCVHFFSKSGYDIDDEIPCLIVKNKANPDENLIFLTSYVPSIHSIDYRWYIDAMVQQIDPMCKRAFPTVVTTKIVFRPTKEHPPVYSKEPGRLALTLYDYNMDLERIMNIKYPNE
jgi:hypothetical protein